MPGVFVTGDLTGVPLLKFAVDSGARAARRVARELADSKRGGDALDLVIIGGGVSGMAAALEARRLGLTFQVLEGAERFATIAAFPRAKPIFTYPPDMTPAGEMQVTADVKESLLAELQRQAADIPTRAARALCVRRATTTLEVELDGEPPLPTRRVIIAIGKTGAHRRLGVPGEDLPHVTNRLHDPADFRARHVVVIGGGDSAAETALALADAGAHTTLVHRGPDLARPKPEIAARARTLPLRLSATVREIRPDAVLLRTPAGDELVQADDVFVMIGRAAPLDFFRRSGIAIAGEWTRAKILACAVFVLFIAALLDWKSGGPLQSAFRAAGWFPYFLPRALSAAFRPEAANTLAGVVARSAQYPGFWYTLAYSLVVVVWGAKRIRRRPTRTIRLQTWTLAAIQVLPLFLLPEIFLPWLDHRGLLPTSAMDALFPAVDWGNGREYWRAYGFILAWPLSIYNVFTDRPLGAWLWISVAQTFVIIPALVWRFGKGAYCGWICSCGALAETLGDAHRKKMPHGPGWNRLNMLGQVILAIAFVLLALRIVGWLAPQSPTNVVFRFSLPAYKWIVDVFLGGVLGVGLYFWFSGRTWCRFACPLAALMHIYARLGRFAILADKKKCISCNVCTSVCHQGIDVMAFAQRGEPMRDPQCVRCSACVADCPTGVLSFGTVDAEGRPVGVDRVPAQSV